MRAHTFFITLRTWSHSVTLSHINSHTPLHFFPRLNDEIEAVEEEGGDASGLVLERRTELVKKMRCGWLRCF